MSEYEVRGNSLRTAKSGQVRADPVMSREMLEDELIDQCL
jgi:hypothetical protein